MKTSESLAPPFTESEHHYWRRKRANEQQRQRREKYRRIDYYPSVEAAAIIDSQTFDGAGGDYSSVIDSIVAEWANQSSGIK